jgi:hypothetical protein
MQAFFSSTAVRSVLVVSWLMFVSSGKVQVRWMHGLVIRSLNLRVPVYEVKSTPYMCSRCIRPASFLPYR